MGICWLLAAAAAVVSVVVVSDTAIASVVVAAVVVAGGAVAVVVAVGDVLDVAGAWAAAVAVSMNSATPSESAANEKR